eukprot:2119030-Ditylum_brightwellii.AAC.1
MAVIILFLVSPEVRIFRIRAMYALEANYLTSCVRKSQPSATPKYLYPFVSSSLGISGRITEVVGFLLLIVRTAHLSR